jgi:iron complex outermembrane recepter protein
MKRSSRTALSVCAILSMVGFGQVQPGRAAESSVTSSGSSDSLGEIIVTAQKRSEKLLDVPIPISAISGDRLQELGVSSLSDLADYVPGLSIENGGTPGQRSIVIRGLSTGYAPSANAPLVATYIDDSPVGASGGDDRSSQLGLDLMPYDIDHIHRSATSDLPRSS